LVWFANYDLFDWFRLAAGWVVFVYATIISVQSLWGWYVWLAGSDRYMTILRRYLIVHGLRLRFGTFWGDLVISILLTVIFFMLWRAHVIIYDLGDRLAAQRTSLANEARLADQIRQRLHERDGVEQQRQH
jgi:hypothetical protein